MAEPTVQAWPTPYRLAGEAFGVEVRISTDSESVLPRLEALLPPGWVAFDPQRYDPPADAPESESPSLRVTTYEGAEPRGDAPPAEHQVPHFTVITHDGLEYLVMRDDVFLSRSDLEIALGVFEAQLRAYIALHSPGRIFVHAGVVGHRGRAIMIPGPSFSGKTTLVAELVRAGATYSSDEYAVLDEAGLVHPYPKPLSVRHVDWMQTDYDVSAFGGSAGEDPLPLGLVVLAQYRPGARWQPRTLSPGETVLALLSNTVPAQERPADTMTALRRVVDDSGAVALAGERGEAAAIVEELLAAVPD